MDWKAPRRRILVTRSGCITVWRAYYHCDQCGRGLHPADGPCALPPGRFTWGVLDRMALLGAWLPFRKTADVFARLTGLDVSRGSLETWTEALGAAYVPPTPDRYTPGPRVDTLFLELDAAMVHFDDGWHEVKVAVCWGRKDGEDLPPRYLTFQGTWEDMLVPLNALARQQGLRGAKHVVVLADGAKPIWTLARQLAPHALGLLDWYHLQEYLAAVAKLLPDGTAWHATQREALAERGPAETLAALRALTKKGKGSRKAVRTAAQRALTYMEGRADELDYPTARKLGYPIGSGRVESAAKQVIQQRCKQQGMRWTHADADKILAARCAYLNGDWRRANEQLVAKYAKAA